MIEAAQIEEDEPETETETADNVEDGLRFRHHSNAFMLYMREAGRYKLLDRDGEIRLGRIIQAKQKSIMEYKKEFKREKNTGKRDIIEQQIAAEEHYLLEAVNEFMNANLLLVVNLAKRHTGCGIDFPDLVQYGNEGLRKGVMRYDPELGNRFSTYGEWWIRHDINRAINNQGFTIRRPVHIHDFESKVKGVIKKMINRLHRLPVPDEIADEIMECYPDLQQNSREKLVSKIEQYAMAGRRGEMLSLDQPRMGDQNDSPLAALLPSDADTGAECENFSTEKLRRSIIARALSALKPAEQNIIRRRFLGDDDKIETLEEIGDTLCLTRERIRQIQEKALRKIKEAIIQEARREKVKIEDL